MSEIDAIHDETKGGDAASFANAACAWISREFLDSAIVGQAQRHPELIPLKTSRRLTWEDPAY